MNSIDLVEACEFPENHYSKHASAIVPLMEKSGIQHWNRKKRPM